MAPLEKVALSAPKASASSAGHLVGRPGGRAHVEELSQTGRSGMEERELGETQLGLVPTRVSPSPAGRGRCAVCGRLRYRWKVGP